MFFVSVLIEYSEPRRTLMLPPFWWPSRPSPGGRAKCAALTATPLVGGYDCGPVSGRAMIEALICKNWYSTLRTVSDHGAHRGHTNDSSVRAFAVKARASGAPLRGFGP
jgi:hypothetical protein